MLDELKTAQANAETEYNNLSNHTWIAGRQTYLKGQYDMLGEVISKLEKEGEQNAPVTSPEGRETPSPNNDQ